MATQIVKQYPKFKYLTVGGCVDGLRPTTDSVGTEVPGIAYVLGGPEDGQQVTDIKMHKTILIKAPPYVRTQKYLALVSYNPALMECGLINCPSLLTPGEPLQLTIKALKGFDISELSYIFKVYLLD